LKKIEPRMLAYIHNYLQGLQQRILIRQPKQVCEVAENAETANNELAH